MREISYDTYLKCLGLFTLANDRYRELQQVEGVLNRLLGVDEGGHIPDAIYNGLASAADLNEALLRENISVAPAVPE